MKKKKLLNNTLDSVKDLLLFWHYICKKKKYIYTFSTHWDSFVSWRMNPSAVSSCNFVSSSSFFLSLDVLYLYCSFHSADQVLECSERVISWRRLSLICSIWTAWAPPCWAVCGVLSLLPHSRKRNWKLLPGPLSLHLSENKTIISENIHKRI